MSIQITKNNQEWETPPELYEQICAEYGLNPTIDVACNSKNCKCKKGIFNDLGRNGLQEEWKENVWCNPPHYQTEKWVRKGFYQWLTNNITITMIIPANTMSTNYWHECIEDHAEYHPILGRIRFLVGGKPSKYVSRNSYVCIIWRKGKQCCTEGEGL